MDYAQKMSTSTSYINTTTNRFSKPLEKAFEILQIKVQDINILKTRLIRIQEALGGQIEVESQKEDFISEPIPIMKGFVPRINYELYLLGQDMNNIDSICSNIESLILIQDKVENTNLTKGNN